MLKKHGPIEAPGTYGSSLLVGPSSMLKKHGPIEAGFNRVVKLGVEWSSMLKKHGPIEALMASGRTIDISCLPC